MDTAVLRRVSHRVAPATLPYLAVWLAVAAWATCALLVRAAHADAVRFTTWRLWFALPPLYAILAVRRRRGSIGPVLAMPDGRRGLWFAVMAAAGALFAAGAATAFAALEKTTLLDATLIPALQPIVVIAVAVLMLGEHVHRGLVVRSAVAVVATAGVAIAASGRGTWSLSGDILAVISLFVNASWHLYGRFIRHRFAIDPFGFMTGALTFAAIFLTPVALAGGGLHISGHAIGYAAAVMVVGTGAHLTMVWAHRYVPASASAPILLVEPPMVAIAGWAVFGDAPSAVEILGSCVVVGSLIGVVRASTLDEADEELEPTV
jgi:drug/metabolite transporter (DMT)-like permease